MLATGANVDESRVTKILYVDPAHTEAADDAKHGTADAPFATLEFACEAAARAKDADTGVKLILAAGIYREEAVVRPPRAGAVDTDAPLVIEAAEREQAVIDGADTEGWSPSTWKVEDSRWTHPWPFRRSGMAHPAGLSASATGESYRRGDLVIVNGTLLRQVNAAADLAPGCLWGMLPVPNGGRHGNAVGGNVGTMVVVQPPEDTELPGSIVQVGVRPHGLTITGRRNVVVRGLLIQHTADPGGNGEKTAGLVLDHCANVLVEDVLCQWNDGTGLTISGRGDSGTASAGFTLRRVRLLHNGGSGLEVSGVQNLLAEDNETSFNNFRGEWAGWIDPQGPAAVKAEAVRDSTWRRQHVIGNVCRGMWWAGEDADVTIEDAAIRGNLVSGICVENNVSPVLIRRCLVAGTKSPPSVRDNPVSSAGLALIGTQDVTLESNIFADNALTQLGLGEETANPTRLAQRHVYRHNVFFCGNADASLYRLAAANTAVKDEFDAYYATLDSQENCFWNPLKTDVFDEYSVRPGRGKTPATYTARTSKLDGWQASAPKEVGARIEVGSLWQDPLFNDPSEGDYRLKPASPVGDWNVPSDEAAASQ